MVNDAISDCDSGGRLVESPPSRLEPDYCVLIEFECLFVDVTCVLINR